VQETQRRAGLTVCPISAERVKQEKLAPQRKLAAMNAISNGTATDEDRALLEPKKQSVEYPDSDPDIQEIA
jgi:hypothetical protein